MGFGRVPFGPVNPIKQGGKAMILAQPNDGGRDGCPKNWSEHLVADTQIILEAHGFDRNLIKDGLALLALVGKLGR